MFVCVSDYYRFSCDCVVSLGLMLVMWLLACFWVILRDYHCCLKVIVVNNTRITSLQTNFPRAANYVVSGALGHEDLVGGVVWVTPDSTPENIRKTK